MIIIEEDEEEEDSQSQYLPQNQLDNLIVSEPVQHIQPPVTTVSQI
jgi:hypothetical protein